MKLTLGVATIALLSGCAADDGPATSFPWETYYNAPRERVLPRSKRPEKLEYYDAMGESDEMRNLLVSLQGVINAKQPEIYLVMGQTRLVRADLEPGHEVFVQEHWLDWMVAHYGVTYTTVSSAGALLARFAKRTKGIIVWDPGQPQTLNIATMLAGFEGGIVATPAQIGLLTPYGLTVIDDLRGRWPNTVAMYRWAFENLYPKCTPLALAFQHVPIPNLRDYLIAHHVFTFELNLYRKDEFALLEEILGRTPQNIEILGWPIEELKGTSTFSRYGKALHASDSNINLSVHSGFEAKTYKQSDAVRFDPNHPLPVENAVYVSFLYTDGDALAYFAGVQKINWDDPERGTFPIAYQVPPVALDVFPDMLEYYETTRSKNDLFIGPVSGLGYFYPNLWPDLMGHLIKAAPYFRDLDLHLIWLLNNNLVFDDNDLWLYAKMLNLDGLFLDYWPTPDRPFVFTSGGTPTFRSQFVYLNGNEQLAPTLIDQIQAKRVESPDAPRFLFFGVNAWRLRPSFIKAALKSVADAGYGPVVVGTGGAGRPVVRVVRADELAALASSARARGLVH